MKIEGVERGFEKRRGTTENNLGGKLTDEGADLMSRAVQRFTESLSRSIRLFLSNSERKTASHFSWNCSARVVLDRAWVRSRIRQREQAYG